MIRISIREADEEEFKNKLRKLCEEYTEDSGYYMREYSCDDNLAVINEGVQW